MLSIGCIFLPTAIYFVCESFRNLQNRNMKMSEQSKPKDDQENSDHKLNTPSTNNRAEICPQNKRYDVNQLLNKCTPDKNHHLRLHNSFSSPLQTLREKQKQEYEWISTPKGPASKSFVIPCNPFDVDVESLSMSSFSPSVFTVTKENSQESMSFRWSIEQLAVLEPVDIDENTQQDLWFDKEKEVKAQKAIDAFFSKKYIVPSPWTPIAKYSTSQIMSNSYPSSKEIRKQFSTEISKQAKEISTQTTLTIPPNVDLSKVLGDFYTYKGEVEEEAESSLNSSSSSNNVDMLSSSSLRRKLFMNEDQIENPDLVNEQNDCAMTSIYETPNIKKSPFCRTPSSDHFSSSPITPKCWSLSMHRISMTPPDISPICAVPRKTSLRSRFSARQQYIEEEAGKLENCSLMLKKPTLDPSVDCPNKALEKISEIEVDSCYNVSWDMSKQENPVQQESCDVPAFPSVYTESSSNQPDTGYLTGSLNSMITQQSSGGMQYRITPVAELLEDCAISKFSQQYLQHQFQCSKMFDVDDSAMVTSLTQNQSLINTNTDYLKNVVWNPAGFSTPTKQSEAML